MSTSILDANKLIAKFMGLILADTGKYYTNAGARLVFMGGDVVLTPYFGPENLLYHSNWEWLMPVLIKIQYSGCLVEYAMSAAYSCRIVKIGSSLRETSKTFTSEDNDPMMAAYMAAVEFIKWYFTEEKHD